MQSLDRKHASDTLGQTAERSKGGSEPVSSRAHTVPASCARQALTTRAEFPGTAEYVARVRQWLRAVLGACPAADDAALLVSELAHQRIAA